MSIYPLGAAAQLNHMDSLEDRFCRAADYTREYLFEQIAHDPTEFIKEWFCESEQCDWPDSTADINNAQMGEVKLWATLYAKNIDNPLNAKYAASFEEWLGWEVENNLYNF